METTPFIGLPCPSPEDYAALALYMQRLAEEVETKLAAQQALITDFATQPTGLWVNANALTSSASSPISAMTIDSVIYTNTPSRALVGFTPDASQGMFPEAGVYHVGWNVTMAELGAVTASSFRQIQFLIRQVSGDGTSLVLQDLSRKVLASTLATERFGNDGLVVVSEANRLLISADISFLHDNVGSQVRITAGALRGWYRRVGSTAQIEVA